MLSNKMFSRVSIRRNYSAVLFCALLGAQSAQGVTPLPKPTPSAKLMVEAVSHKELAEEISLALESSSLETPARNRLKVTLYAVSKIDSATAQQRNRFFSKIKSLLNLEHRGYLQEVDLDKVNNVDELFSGEELEETRKLWAGYKAASVLVSEAGLIQESLQAKIRQWTTAFRSDLATYDGQIKTSPVQVDVEFNGVYTEKEKKWARLTEEVLEESLLVLENFPINLPETSNAGQGEIVDENAVFKRPASFESEIGYDDSGNRIWVKDQTKILDSIKQTAKFYVESKEYPGRYHEFIVDYLVNGQDRIKAVFNDGMAVAGNQFTIHIPKRFASDKLSFKNAKDSMQKALFNIVDSLVGLRNLVPAYSEGEVAMKVAQQRIQLFSDQLKEVGGTKETPSFVFETLDGSKTKVDLRLQSPAFAKQVSDEVGEIVQKLRIELTPQRVAFLKTAETNYRTKHPEWSDAQIVTAIENAWDALLQVSFETAIYRSEKLIELDAVQLVENQYKVNRLAEAIFTKKAAEVASEKAEVTKKIVEESPYRSTEIEWLDKQVAKRMEGFEAQAMADAENELLVALQKSELPGYAWRVQQSKAQKTELKALAEKLTNEKAPGATYRFDALKFAWDMKPENIGTEESPHWVINIQDTHEMNTAKLGWKFKVLGLRSHSWFRNVDFAVAISNLWEGPLGLQSMFRRKPYKVLTGVKRETGEAIYKRLNTMTSRFAETLKWGQENIENFERQPDNGEFPKRWVRPLVYARAGLGVGVGFLAYGPVSLIGTTLNAIASSAYIAASIPVSGTVGVLGWVGDIVLDRTPGKEDEVRSIVTEAGRFLFPGVAQAAGALGATVAIHPGGSAGTALLTGIGAGAMWTWDAVFFNTYWRHLGRVPVKEKGWTVRHVAGPGKASQYYFQIPHELSVVAANAWLEDILLGQYKSDAEKTLNQATKLYSQYESHLLASVLGTDGNGESNVGIGKNYIESQVEESVKDFKQELEQQVRLVRKETKSVLDLRLKDMIKFEKAELLMAIQKTSLLLEDRVSKRYFSNLGENEIEKFWSNKDLLRNDWVGLSKRVLSKLFGSSILEPLEDSDFALEVDRSWDNFFDRLDDGRLFEDSDLVVVKLLNSYRKGLPGLEGLNQFYNDYFTPYDVNAGEIYRMRNADSE